MPVLTARWRKGKGSVCCLTLAILMVGTACSDSTAPSSAGVAHIRVINSLFQDDGTNIVPVSIDFLFDSATTTPSVFGIPRASHAAGDSANGYQSLSPRVHSYIARRAGDTSLYASVFTTSTDLPYLPRLFLAGATYYTAIVAGVIPATGNIPNNTVPFTLIVDDPFPGPTFQSVVQARFRVVNAAPYTVGSGNGATVLVYVTPGSTPPVGSITQYASLAAAGYRNGSAYVNVDPGTYVITITAGGVIVAQQMVTFAAGEVRSLILQSVMSGAPNPSTNVLTNLLDHQY